MEQLTTFSYYWKITRTDYDRTNGRIAKVFWSCSSENKTVSGGIDLPLPSGVMEPYDSITEVKILDWLFSSRVNKDGDPSPALMDKDNIESFIADSISSKIVSGTPWVETSGVSDEAPVEAV